MKGNTPLEVFAAVAERTGLQTGVDLHRRRDVAEDLTGPMMDQPIRVDRDLLTPGYAGVYSSFLPFAQRAARKYDLSARDVLVETGRRKAVSGQKDLIKKNHIRHVAPVAILGARRLKEMHRRP